MENCKEPLDFNNQDICADFNYQFEFEELRTHDSNDLEDSDVSEDEHEVWDFPPTVCKIKKSEAENKEDHLQLTSDNTEVNFLTKWEQEVINGCSNSNLKKLLLLNRSKNIQLLKFYEKVSNLYKETRTRISEEKAKLLNLPKCSASRTGVYKLGIPYFKDKEFYACIPNSDVFKKMNNREFYNFEPTVRWRLEDESFLRSAVSLYSPKCLNDVESLEAQNESKSEMLRVPPLTCSDGINWQRVSEHLKGRHSPSACRAYWTLLQHPEINKSDWTADENAKIKKLAIKYKHENWDAIATELNTGRTGYTICVHYFSKLSDKFRKDRFVPEEDEFLLEIIENCRVGTYIPWTKVCYYFQFRSRQQLYQRYKYCLSVQNVKKTKFTVEEDALIVCLVKRFGRDFQAIAAYVPERNAAQIKNRYSCYLQNLDHVARPWTLEEDKKILEFAAKHETRVWSGLAKELNRTRGNVRHRYGVLARWKKNYPDTDLSHVQRRTYQENNDKLNKEIQITKELIRKFDNYDTIPTLEMFGNHGTDQKKKFSGPAHTGLINFFKSSYEITKKTSIDLTDNNLKRSASLIHSILQYLGTDIEIPHENILKTYRNIDVLDITLLNHISEEQSERKGLKPGLSQESSNRLLPPNLNTVAGLRNVILRRSSYKNKFDPKKVDLDLNRVLEDDLNSLSSDEYQLVIQDRELFKKRLLQIFKWPSVLSLREPTSSFSTVYFQSNQPPKKKRNVGRPKSFIAKKLKNIEKMTEAKKAKKKSIRNNVPVKKCNEKPKKSEVTVIDLEKYEDMPKSKGLRKCNLPENNKIDKLPNVHTSDSQCKNVDIKENLKVRFITDINKLNGNVKPVSIQNVPDKIRKIVEKTLLNQNGLQTDKTTVSPKINEKSNLKRKFSEENAPAKRICVRENENNNAVIEINDNEPEQNNIEFSGDEFQQVHKKLENNKKNNGLEEVNVEPEHFKHVNLENIDINKLEIVFE